MPPQGSHKAAQYKHHRNRCGAETLNNTLQDFNYQNQYYHNHRCRGKQAWGHCINRYSLLATHPCPKSQTRAYSADSQTKPPTPSGHLEGNHQLTAPSGVPVLGRDSPDHANEVTAISQTPSQTRMMSLSSTSTTRSLSSTFLLSLMPEIYHRQVLRHPSTAAIRLAAP